MPNPLDHPDWEIISELFDNYVYDYDSIHDDGDPIGVWSQVCPVHVEFASQFGELQPEGSGICGVKGCNNQSEHYVDFDLNYELGDDNDL